jgi:hypothetical protein
MTKDPQTAEDHVVIALEKFGCEGVVRILRDWVGSKQLRRSLDKLHHRDPVSRFKHARRHAVALYAEEQGLIPANLLVEIRGIGGRSDPKGSERAALRKARKFLETDPNALIGAKALARFWLSQRPSKLSHAAHLKQILKGCDF